MFRNVCPSLITREDEVKFEAIRTNVNRPGLNGSNLGVCKLCRKLGGGKEKIYKYLRFSNLIKFCSDCQELIILFFYSFLGEYPLFTQMHINSMFAFCVLIVSITLQS